MHMGVSYEYYMYIHMHMGVSYEYYDNTMAIE